MVLRVVQHLIGGIADEDLQAFGGRACDALDGLGVIRVAFNGIGHQADFPGYGEGEAVGHFGPVAVEEDEDGDDLDQQDRDDQDQQRSAQQRAGDEMAFEERAVLVHRHQVLSCRVKRSRVFLAPKGRGFVFTYC